MYSRGLTNFLERKKLSSKEAITAFLNYKEKSNFTYKNHNQTDAFIQAHWNEFASFIDKSLKNKTIKGLDIKLNTYYDEQAERKEHINAEYNSLPKEIIELYKLICKYDDKVRLSKCDSLLKKNGYNFPANAEGISRIKKVSPKLEYILSVYSYNEIKDYLINKI